MVHGQCFTFDHTELYIENRTGQQIYGPKEVLGKNMVSLFLQYFDHEVTINVGSINFSKSQKTMLGNEGQKDFFLL